MIDDTWYMIHDIWSTIYDIWSTIDDLRSAICNRWPVMCVLWSMIDVRYMMCDIWCTIYDVRYMIYDLWMVVQSFLHGTGTLMKYFSSNINDWIIKNNFCSVYKMYLAILSLITSIICLVEGRFRNRLIGIWEAYWSKHLQGEL